MNYEEYNQTYNIIYALKNTENNKIYIGQTWLTLNRRGHCGNGYDRCPYLNNAIQKYGWDKFYYEILTITHTQEQADYWEIYFIKRYNSIDRNFGYNLRLGSTTGKLSAETRRKLSLAKLGKPGHKHSLETKLKISLINKGRKRTQEQLLKMSQKAKGNKNCLGRILSQETKDKIGKSRSEFARKKKEMMADKK